MTPDVIKIDVEGAEVVVLKGMRRTISRAGERLKMFVECNPSMLRLAGTSHEALFRLLGELGFQVGVVDERQGCVAPVTEEIMAGNYKYVNLYCVKE